MSTTESPSNFNHLEQMSVHDLLVNINQEDETVSNAVKEVIPDMEV